MRICMEAWKPESICTQDVLANVLSGPHWLSQPRPARALAAASSFACWSFSSQRLVDLVKLPLHRCGCHAQRKKCVWNFLIDKLLMWSPHKSLQMNHRHINENKIGRLSFW